MKHIILSDLKKKLYINSDGHYGKVSNFRELVYIHCTPFRVCEIARARNVSISITRVNMIRCVVLGCVLVYPSL